MDRALTENLAAQSSHTTTISLWVVPFILALLGMASLSIDLPVAKVFKEKTLPEVIDRQLRDALEICETFGHGFGATLIIIGVAVLSPGSRWDIPWVVSGSLGAGMVANLIKLTVHRIRPVNFDTTADSVWRTFDRDFSHGGPMQSFPSSHTATAVGLAVMLSALFPRGRWYFMVLALLVGLQRIVSSAHFPSDVCGGAIVGWLVASACVYWSNSTCRPFSTSK